MDLFTVFLLSLCLFNNLFLTGYGPYAFSIFVLCLVSIDLILKRHPSLPPKLANLLIRNQTEDQDRILSGILEEVNFLEYRATEIESRSEDELRPLKGTRPAASSSLPYFYGRNAVVGMDKDFEELKERLCWDSSNLEVIPIVGMGGIGKTTLAAQAYTDSYILQHFDICAWTMVSQQYSFRQVMLDLVRFVEPKAKQLFGEDTDGVLCEYLYKTLYGRRYLIVMDDVWDIMIWDKVKKCLPNQGNGSRVLLTTRMLHVAFLASSGGRIHHMHCLDEHESQRLLYSRVFGEKNCPDELRKIGDEIARRCKGFPLTLVVIAHLVSTIDQTKERWKQFLDSVNAVIEDDRIMGILALSYNHLPQHLRPCFLYMGMFPEDYEVPVTKLTHLWAAEGFLQQSKSFESLEKISTEYLEDLVGRSLILVSHRNSQGKIKRCKIHDIMRILCLYVARKEKLFVVVNGPENFHREGIKSYQRIVLHPNVLRIRPNILDHELHCKSITHSLLCMGDNFDVLGDNIQFNFLHYKLLRVLDLLIIHLSKFPLEVCNLISLRYLALSFTGMLHPHISRLWNLQTVVHRDLSSSCTDSKLPVEIWMMPNLQHLYVPATFLSSPPIGSKASFNLQTLVEVINLSFGIQILEKIKSVKKLVVSYDLELESFKGWSGHRLRNLSRLNQLEKLSLRVNNSFIPSSVSYPWNLAFPQSLKNFTLSGCRIPWRHLRIVGRLPNLEVLKLRDNACQGEKWEPIEGEYGKLKYLELQHLDLVNWTADDVNFPCLEHLAVKSCHLLEVIPLGIGGIPTLKRIELVDCLSGVVTCAENILEEQQCLGNSELKVMNFRDGHLRNPEEKNLSETKVEKTFSPTLKDQSKKKEGTDKLKQLMKGEEEIAEHEQAETREKIMSDDEIDRKVDEFIKMKENLKIRRLETIQWWETIKALSSRQKEQLRRRGYRTGMQMTANYWMWGRVAVAAVILILLFWLRPPYSYLLIYALIVTVLVYRFISHKKLKF